jgi:hypothetical protein
MFPHNFDFEVTEEEEDVSAIDFEDDDPAGALRFERGPWPASNSMDESITCAIREFIDKGGASFPVALETAMDMAQQNQLMFLLRFNACEIPRNVQVRERLVDEEDQFSFIVYRTPAGTVYPGRNHSDEVDAALEAKTYWSREHWPGISHGMHKVFEFTSRVDGRLWGHHEPRSPCLKRRLQRQIYLGSFRNGG